MKTYPSAQEVAAALVRTTRLKRTSAYIQDIDPLRAGHAFVFIQASDGTYYRDSLPVRTVVQMVPGMAVKIGLDSDKNMAIMEPDFLGQVAQGVDPHTNNPSNRYFYGTYSQDPLKTFWIGAIGTVGTPSLSIVVLEFFYYDQGLWYFLARQLVDLTSYIPAANTHRLVLIYLKTDHTIGVAGSTAQNLGDLLDETDCDQATAAATGLLAFGKFVKLYGGQTNIKEPDIWRDARPVVNLQAQQYATLQTTTATESTLATMTVAEASVVTWRGTFTGVKSDYTAAIGGVFTAILRRATGGNVALVGQTVTKHEDSSGTPDFLVDVTGAASARLRVVGIAAETWNWKVSHERLIDTA